MGAKCAGRIGAGIGHEDHDHAAGTGDDWTRGTFPDTVVTASQNAKEMGGSQINLDTGEQMTVHDLLMSVAVASANDAALALAEEIGGSESGFVTMMNRRAEELGMTHTQFQNPHGLPEEGHYTCAEDIALMTAALIENSLAAEYIGCETYTIRSDTNPYQMRTTNKMLSSYDGCLGGQNRLYGRSRLLHERGGRA